MAQLSLIALLVTIAATSAEIIPFTVVRYPVCGSNEGIIHYYQRFPRHVLPHSPCAMRNSNFQYGVSAEKEEGPWKFSLPLNLYNTPCSTCPLYSTKQPSVISLPTVSPCTKTLTPPPASPSLPNPTCKDNYLFSCEPRIVPVPCQNQY